jgi:hypothetical protein
MAQLGTGITLSFNGVGIGEITDISLPNGKVESLRTSWQGTTVAHTFTPSRLLDAGEMKVEMWFDPYWNPPFQVIGLVNISFPNGPIWQFYGFFTGYEPTVTFEELMKVTATIKVSGAIWW